uniref:Uncharacterized protein n=1 Tax=viral metagenome TaxID=1070528 RepID=A0A6M3LBD9_9ZZZZ
MYQTVNFYDFERAFVTANRADSFSYHGKRALFDYLEELGDSGGADIELDVVAICCDFSEYKSALEAVADYDFTPLQYCDDEETEENALKWLQDQTTALSFDGGVIIQAF